MIVVEMKMGGWYLFRQGLLQWYHLCVEFEYGRLVGGVDNELLADGL